MLEGGQTRHRQFLVYLNNQGRISAPLCPVRLQSNARSSRRLSQESPIRQDRGRARKSHLYKAGQVRRSSFTRETVCIAWVHSASSCSGCVAPPGIHKGQNTTVIQSVWKIFHFESLKNWVSVKKCKLSLSLVDKKVVSLKNFQSGKIK